MGIHLKRLYTLDFWHNPLIFYFLPTHRPDLVNTTYVNMENSFYTDSAIELIYTSQSQFPDARGNPNWIMTGPALIIGSCPQVQATERQAAQMVRIGPHLA